MEHDSAGSQLGSEKCAACNRRTPRLGETEIEQLQRALNPEWQVVEGRLHRHYAFADFVSALTQTTAIGLVAEAEGHHPDLRLGWGYLDVELFTHVIKALSRNDFILAAKIDALTP